MNLKLSLAVFAILAPIAGLSLSERAQTPNKYLEYPDDEKAGKTNDDNLFCNDHGPGGECLEFLPDVTDKELLKLSEELFGKETHDLSRYITVNFQGRTTSKTPNDEALEPLLTVQKQAFETPTISRFLMLLDNYELETRVEENLSLAEHDEEDALIDALLSTNTMSHAMQFLSGKGFFKDDLYEHKEILKRIWFTQYSRGRGVYGSSGFEHVFLAEMKPRSKIIGLHNWIFFHAEETAGRLNYLGYIRDVEIYDRTWIAQLHFTLNGKKKTSSIFIGTSPELELALYTVCFFTRPDSNCKLSLAGTRISIQTYRWEDDGRYLVAAAFPAM